MKALIGREKETRKLNGTVFTIAPGDRFRKCWSIIGPHGIGKTYLVEQLVERLSREPQPHVYIVATTLGTEGAAEAGTGAGVDAPVVAFWKAFMGECEEKVTKSELEKAPGYKDNPDAVQEILKVYEFFRNKNVPIEDVSRNVKSYLGSLKIIGIRLIWIIDEFDEARKLFSTETFFSILFALSPKATGSSAYDISILLLCRRDPASHNFLTGSNFGDGFPAFPLAGFNNAELEEYWETYQELPCGVPEEETRQFILYLCGRSPELLTAIRDDVFRFAEPDEAKSTQWVYNEFIERVRGYCSRTIELMEGERLREDPDVSYLDVFIQAFIGPAYDERIIDKTEEVKRHGFVCKKGENESDNIFALAGLGETEDAKVIKERDYEPLSPYFLEYIREDVLPKKEKNIVTALNAVERKIRVVIHDALKDDYPDEDALEAAACEGLRNPGKKQSFKSSLARAIEDNHAGERGFRASMVNVLSFPEYYEIIQHHAKLMSPYFSTFKNGYQLRNEWKDLRGIFQKLKDLRDLGHHNNIEIIAPGDLPELIKLCDDLLKNMTSPGEAWDMSAKVVVKGSAGGSAPKAPAASAADGSIEDTWAQQAREVTISRLTVTNRGNLVGFFIDEATKKEYKVSIPAARLEDMELDAKELQKSGSVKVKLTQFSRGNPNDPANTPYFQGAPVREETK